MTPAPPLEAEAPLPEPALLPGGIAVHRGVPYADLPGRRPLELDLWLPPGPDPHPVVLFLHGGGWQVGSRRSAGPMYADRSPFMQLAAAGLAVASADYRLSGEDTWPSQRDDATAALAWLRRRGAEAGLDADRVAVWGESAGAHLAAHVALRADPAVRAAVTWYVPSDLAAMAEELGTTSDDGTREALLLGASTDADPDRARDASPVTHVAASSTRWLLLHGEADDLVPATQSVLLHAALRESGVEADLHFFPDVGHLWLGRPHVADDALRRTCAFLERALRP